MDIVIIFFFFILIGVPSWAIIWLYPYVEDLPSISEIPLLVIVFNLVFIVSVAIVFRMVPRPKPGKYPFPNHIQTRYWALHFALQRIAMLPILRQLIMSTSYLRYLILKALGGHIPFDIWTSSDVSLGEAYLIRIGTNSLLGGGSEISCHFIKDGLLVLAPTTLEENVQLLKNAIVGPDCYLKKNSVVGTDSLVGYKVVLGEGSQIGSQCYLMSHVKIGNNVKIGDAVRIEPGSVVDDGVRIPAGTWIRRGTHVTVATPFEDTRWQVISSVPRSLCTKGIV
jgi:acetyltransferase-like isoleucine patch superfamily enzyme